MKLNTMKAIFLFIAVLAIQFPGANALCFSDSANLFHNPYAVINVYDHTIEFLVYLKNKEINGVYQCKSSNTINIQCQCNTRYGSCSPKGINVSTNIMDPNDASVSITQKNSKTNLIYIKKTDKTICDTIFGYYPGLTKNSPHI